MYAMKSFKVLLVTAAAASAVVIAARSGEGGVSMHPLDWRDGAGVTSPRRYRSAGHLLHHAGELARLSVPLAEVYVMRALPAVFREQVMIVTAMANDCSA